MTSVDPSACYMTSVDPSACYILILLGWSTDADEAGREHFWESLCISNQYAIDFKSQHLQTTITTPQKPDFDMTCIASGDYGTDVEHVIVV